MTDGATLPPHPLPGLDAAWSRLVTVADGDGVARTWHVLDNQVPDPELTLLCVHGNPTWSYLWRRLLAVAPPGWRVVAPDQLGMGYSDRLDSPRSLHQRVSDLGHLTSALRVQGPTVTVAHDWGGPVSLGWAAAHRDQLRGVVLTNTAVHLPEHTAGPVLIRLVNLRALRNVVCVRTPTFVRTATRLSRPPLPVDVRRAFAAPYAHAHRRQSVADFVADIPFSSGHPSRRTLDRVARETASLDSPVLLLWGPRDPVFGQAHLDDLLDRLPHADLHRYEGASHLLAEDAPQYADTVVQWVGDLGRVPSGADGADTATRSASPAATRPGQRLLLQRLGERADDPGAAIVDVGRRVVSWTLLARRVEEIAAGLAAIGVRRGDRVALLVPPSADLTAAVYAVWRAGAVVVVADKGLGLRGMGRALRGARLDHVIGTTQGLLAARAMCLPGTRIGAGRTPRRLLRALGADVSLADLSRLGRRMAAPAMAVADDECAVAFTSGATGAAKGVVYRHRQVEAQLDLVRSTYALTAEDRIVAAFAPFSLFGPALGIGSAVPDMDVTSPGTLTAAALADAVAAIRATVVFASPAALRNVVSTAGTLTGSQREALAGVRLLMSAGAPVPARLLRDLRGVLTTAEIHTPYGMTEVLPVTDISLQGIESAGSGEGVCVGTPLPGVDVAVSRLSMSGAADAPLVEGPGPTGEICVRAAHVKDHYDALWGTQRLSTRDPGWHRTGDVGHVDHRGRLWIEGRLEHVMTTPGGPVTPIGIEQRVEALDDVLGAAAVGVGPVGVQQVAVVVVTVNRPRPGRPPVVAPQAMTEAVRRVAGVEVAAVLVTPALPVDIRHASKVDRCRVAEWAARVLAGREA